MGSMVSADTRTRVPPARAHPDCSLPPHQTVPAAGLSRRVRRGCAPLLVSCRLRRCFMTATLALDHRTANPALPETGDPGPLQAVHTSNFPAFLRRLGASLLATTYQAGKLVIIRDEGGQLNT